MHDERRNLFLKSITEDINQKAATTPIMERWEREQSLSVGAAQPWHRLSSLELIYQRELLHLDGLQIPCQNPILISMIIILSDSVILFPKL